MSFGATDADNAFTGLSPRFPQGSGPAPPIGLARATDHPRDYAGSKQRIASRNTSLRTMD